MLSRFLYCSRVLCLWQFKVSQDDMIKKDRINEIATDRIAKGEVSLLGAPPLLPPQSLPCL